MLYANVKYNICYTPVNKLFLFKINRDFSEFKMAELE